MKKIALVTSGLLAALSISAASAEKVQIEFWTWYLSPKFDNYIKDTIASFEKANPNVDVKWFDKQDSMVQDFTTSVALGKSPDVINLNIEETFKAAQNGIIIPLNKDALAKQFHPQPVANFTVNGKPFGYPWYGWLNEGVLFYNKDLYKKAGLTRAPKTQAELLKYAKVIKDKTGAYGYVPSIKDPNGASFLGFFFTEGLDIYDAQGNATFNSAAHVKLLQQYIDLFKGGYFPADVLRREAFQLATELYAQGKLANVVGGPQALTRIKDNNKSLYEKTVVVAAPLGSAKVQTGGGMDLVIPTASKNQKEAQAFAAFVSNNVNQMAFAKIVPIVPTSKGAEKDAFFKVKSNDPIAKATGLVGAQGRFINPGFKPPKNSDDIYKNFNDNIEAAFLGQKTAEKALNDAVAYWNKNDK